MLFISSSFFEQSFLSLFKEVCQLRIITYMKAYHIIRPYKDHISDNYFVSKTKQKKN